MERGYQYDFSSTSSSMFDTGARQKKARTMVAVLGDHIQQPLRELSVLNVGGSAGIIDEYLSHHAGEVIGIDIDQAAIIYAQEKFQRDNLRFEVGDAMNLSYANERFDIVISSQVYEHVPDAARMMDEIYRVLKPGGVCYFAAGNRLMWNEPHHNLPLLSVIPRPLAHVYLRLAGKGRFYYEKHLGYWGLKRLVGAFTLIDYTRRIIENPEKFSASYMIKPGSLKAGIARLVVRYLPWLTPGYIWVLRKPACPECK